MSAKKSPSKHPWDKIRKHKHVDEYKHGHNSVFNPRYPVKKDESPIQDYRDKFTIIGNRITKEFIYCSKLILDLYKHRKKKFELPVIQGVTGVEWPDVWNRLKINFGSLAHCLKSQVAVLLNDKFLGGEEELKELVETKYTFHLDIDYCKESEKLFVEYIRNAGRPCAYMHISIDNAHVGTFIFMLYADLVPNTCNNFLRLCKTRRGGYNGTPVHRIVKDGWIQCGGFGLKSTDLNCENFIVPHDKRGVLCMANDGRHVDCSTQFFVLLQPATWMAHKYVAFGQLIDGEDTLRKVENVPTWYESPVPDIKIYRAGILNLECQDIKVNKGTNQYIQGHIEDLVVLGEVLFENLMEKVFMELEFKRVAELEACAEDETNAEEVGLKATERFIRKKEDIQQQIESSKEENRFSVETENLEFDVEVYEYEPEESYQHVSLAESTSTVKEQKPYYLPLTDVPYPGEVESKFDLKRFLQGRYCLENDLQEESNIRQEKKPFPSEVFHFEDESLEPSPDDSLGSDDEKEIQKYLKMNVDRVSFAGGVIRGIARGVGKFNLFEDSRKSEMITDEDLRRIRLASIDHRFRDKKVSISVPNEENTLHPAKIKRRQTGFVRPEDLEKIHLIQKSMASSASNDDVDDDDHDDSNIAIPRKVRIAPAPTSASGEGVRARRQTGFVHPIAVDDSETDLRQSVLTRLYDDVKVSDEQGPTLKDYKPLSETQRKNIFLMTSPNARIKTEDNSRGHYLRPSLTVEDDSYEQALNMQHGKRVARKVSSDYVKTIDHMEQKTVGNSVRSIEFAKTRPTLSVTEYQLKNQRYEELKKASQSQDMADLLKNAPRSVEKEINGLRLPGDTPLYSVSDVGEV